MDRGSTGSGLITAKRGKNQQAGKFRRLEPTTLVMGTCNSKPVVSKSLALITPSDRRRLVHIAAFYSKGPPTFETRKASAKVTSLRG